MARLDDPLPHLVAETILPIDGVIARIAGIDVPHPPSLRGNDHRGGGDVLRGALLILILRLSEVIP